MREKILIYSMLVVLAILIGRLCYYEIWGKKDNAVYAEISESEFRRMEIQDKNETQDLYESEQESLPEYAKLYPDLYVEENEEQDLFQMLVQSDLEKVKRDSKARTEKKIAYLTFDDGPSYITKKVMDILEEYDIKATFFVIGNQVEEGREDTIKQLHQRGHVIGVHTYSHVYSDIYQSVENYLNDFYKVYNIIYEITGEKPCIFRFPGGSKNTYTKNLGKSIISEMERRGFQYYDWNVSAEDSVGTPSEYSIKNNVLKNAKRFSDPVILMHDSSVNELTVKALPSIIKTLQEEGYEFDVLSSRECCHFK